MSLTGPFAAGYYRVGTAIRPGRYAALAGTCLDSSGAPHDFVPGGLVRIWHTTDTFTEGGPYSSGFFTVYVLETDYAVEVKSSAVIVWANDYPASFDSFRVKVPPYYWPGVGLLEWLSLREIAQTAAGRGIPAGADDLPYGGKQELRINTGGSWFCAYSGGIQPADNAVLKLKMPDASWVPVLAMGKRRFVIADRPGTINLISGDTTSYNVGTQWWDSYYSGDDHYWSTIAHDEHHGHRMWANQAESMAVVNPLNQIDRFDQVSFGTVDLARVRTAINTFGADNVSGVYLQFEVLASHQWIVDHAQTGPEQGPLRQVWVRSATNPVASLAQYDAVAAWGDPFAGNQLSVTGLGEIGDVLGTGFTALGSSNVDPVTGVYSSGEADTSGYSFITVALDDVSGDRFDYCIQVEPVTAPAAPDVPPGDAFYDFYSQVQVGLVSVQLVLEVSRLPGLF